MPASGPVHMAIQQSANDAAVDHALVGLVVIFGFKICNDAIAFDKALDLQSFFVGWTAAKANKVGSELVLKALANVHGD